MIDVALVASPNATLYEIVQEELVKGSNGSRLCADVLPRVRTCADVAAKIAEKGSNILFLDAVLPRDPDTANDLSGRPVIDLLQQLRKSGCKVPAIVIVPGNMSEIDDFRERNSDFETLSLQRLSRDRIVSALEKVRAIPGAAMPQDTTIELDIGLKTNALRVFDGNGNQIRERANFVRDLTTFRFLAEKFAEWKMFEVVVEKGDLRRSVPTKGWIDLLEGAGQSIYRELTSDSLWADTISDLRQTPDGLNRLNIRFNLPPEFFAVPFEALYDYGVKKFIRIFSPIARRLETSTIRGQTQIAGTLRILFVFAQVEGSLRLVDDQRQEVAKSHWFEPLSNLKRELDHFDQLKKAGKWRQGTVEVDIVRGPEGNRSFLESLQELLASRKYSFVHFAGHSYCAPDGRTFLVLPSEEEDQLVGLPVRTFAKWVGDADARFVFLSSCRGSSVDSVRELVSQGIPQVLGFRWDVEDDSAASFAKLFYDQLLTDNQPIAKAYRNACGKLQELNTTSPIWVSPMLIMQTPNWWSATAQ